MKRLNLGLAIFFVFFCFNVVWAAEQVKIGLIYPLSGPIAYDGQSVVNGAKLAAEEINSKMKEAANNSLKGILEYNSDPIVSSDIIGNPHSSVFSSIWTKAIEDEVFVLSYYDNEWGFSNRMVDLILKVDKL